MSKLQDQLDQITANTRNLVQPERLEISERAVAELSAAVRAAPRVLFVPLLSADSDDEIVAWVEAGAAAVVECRGRNSMRDILDAVQRGELLCSGRVAGALLHPRLAFGIGSLGVHERQQHHCRIRLMSNIGAGAVDRLTSCSLMPNIVKS